MSLLSLANELLFGVAENLDLVDLKSLLQANRRLSTILTPIFRKLSTSRENATAALYCAAAVNTNKDLVKLLLENGEGISVFKDTALHARPLYTSPGKCNDDVVRFVLEQRANLVLRDGIALHWAAAKRRKALVKVLLENGANVRARDPRGAITALHQACAGPEKNDEVIKLLLDKGADIAARDIHGRPVLDWAVGQNNYSGTMILIERGADVNFQDADGATALHVAASLEDGSMVRLLLDKGAYVDSKDFGGMTALHIAASRGHETAVRLLLENGADINAQDGRKWSPLHLAALGGEIYWSTCS